MKITYLQCGKHNKKLFSWYRHDFQVFQPNEDEYYMIDGGASLGEQYCRFSQNGTVEQRDIKELMQDIRSSFQWGQNYDKNNKLLDKTKYILLKDLDSSHICNIITVTIVNVVVVIVS